MKMFRLGISFGAAWLLVPALLCAQRGASEPQIQELTTSDGVRLVATYYPSKLGKKATPVLMLHDWKESRTVFDPLAQKLSGGSQPSEEGEAPALEFESFAVVTLDLRGHGDSVRQVAPNGATRGALSRETLQARLPGHDSARHGSGSQTAAREERCR